MDFLEQEFYDITIFQTPLRYTNTDTEKET